MLKNSNKASIEDIKKIFDNIEAELSFMPEGENKFFLTKFRVNQSKFRDYLLKRQGQCVVSGVMDKSLLIASYIKPWKYSDIRTVLHLNFMQTKNLIGINPFTDANIYTL